MLSVTKGGITEKDARKGKFRNAAGINYFSTRCNK